MINNFRNIWLSNFYANGIHHRYIPRQLEQALARKLDIIAAAKSAVDLISPPSNRFEHLQGRLRNYCSIRVNRQYRLIFQWDELNGKALNVYLDAHNYR